MPNASRIAILAYGSVIHSPGPELDAATVERRLTTTPFRIEYARSSGSRAGAPTLIPFDAGSCSAGMLLVLRPGTTLTQAESMLWHRETGGKGVYKRPKNDDPNRFISGVFTDFEGVEAVIYTIFGANIQPLTAERLAELAVDSAKSAEVSRDKNGIAYLLQTINLGTRTPLSMAYEAAVLKRTGTSTLEEALASTTPPCR